MFRICSVSLSRFVILGVRAVNPSECVSAFPPARSLSRAVVWLRPLVLEQVTDCSAMAQVTVFRKGVHPDWTFPAWLGAALRHLIPAGRGHSTVKSYQKSVS